MSSDPAEGVVAPPDETIEELYEHAPCGYLTVDRSGLVVRVNATLSDWIGRGALVGQQVQSLLTPASRIFYETHVAPLVWAEAVVGQVALDIACADGRRLSVLANWRRVDGPDGRPIGARAMLVDASDRRDYERELLAERKRARGIAAELRETETELRVALNAAEAGAWQVDIATSDVTYDGVAARLHELNDGDPVKLTPAEWWRIVPREYHEAARASLRGAVIGGEPVDISLPIPRRDGGTRWIRSIGGCDRDPDGRTIRLLGITIDITAQREAADREALLAREVDHRAKNLLAVVQSVIALTRAETIKDYSEAIIGRVQSLARAHSLLADARWDGADFTGIVGEELAAFADKAERVRSSGPVIMLKPAAAQSLALIVHELATNCAKYGALSADGGTLDFRWHFAADQLVLTWIEEGGPLVIAPTRSGFGSKLMKSSVERQLKGSIDFDWRPGGLRCTIILPAVGVIAAAAEEVFVAAPVATSGASEAAGNKGRILVVEDDVLIGLLVEQALLGDGHQVVGPAATVVDALQLIEAGQAVDLALLDVDLEGERSFPVADALSARNIDFAFCTGFVGARTLPERFRGRPIIAKPFVAERLVEQLNGLLAS